jgi:hypothetical protein
VGKTFARFNAASRLFLPSFSNEYRTRHTFYALVAAVAELGSVRSHDTFAHTLKLMSELISFLNVIGWIMGGIGLLALWVNRSMRKEREQERQREASKAGGHKDAA